MRDMNRFHVELWFDSDAETKDVEFLYETHEFEVLEETLALTGKKVGKTDREMLVTVNEELTGPEHGCSKHRDMPCLCVAGVVDSNLELWAQCLGCGATRGICCDNGHEFLRRSEEPNQMGHAWVDSGRCRECCPRHSPRANTRKGRG